MSDAYGRRDPDAAPWGAVPEDANRRPPSVPRDAPPDGAAGGALRAVPPLISVQEIDEGHPPTRSEAGGPESSDVRRGPTHAGDGQGPEQMVGVGGSEPTERGAGQGRTEVEQPVPLAERLRSRAADLAAASGSSIPIRTVLFALPPFVLPPLAFDLSIGQTIAVAVLLLWLAGAAGVLATVMFDGSDQLALRAIERRVAHLAERPDGQASEAVLAIGEQLDVLTDRVEQLAASGASAASHPAPPASAPQSQRHRASPPVVPAADAGDPRDPRHQRDSRDPRGPRDPRDARDPRL